jgi:hypothetical protein
MKKHINVDDCKEIMEGLGVSEL